MRILTTVLVFLFLIAIPNELLARKRHKAPAAPTATVVHNDDDVLFRPESPENFDVNMDSGLANSGHQGLSSNATHNLSRYVTKFDPPDTMLIEVRTTFDGMFEEATELPRHLSR